jgi:hypothetical protein
LIHPAKDLLFDDPFVDRSPGRLGRPARAIGHLATQIRIEQIEAMAEINSSKRAVCYAPRLGIFKKASCSSLVADPSGFSPTVIR